MLLFGDADVDKVAIQSKTWSVEDRISTIPSEWCSQAAFANVEVCAAIDFSSCARIPLVHLIRWGQLP